MNNSKKSVYLDTTASMLITPPAKQAIEEYYKQPFACANPNSLHTYGRETFKLFEEARKTLARALGAKRPQEIIFTSGGTESDNSALIGISLGVRDQHQHKNTVLISAFEHEAVEMCEKPLKRLGFTVKKVPVTHQGFVDVEALKELLDENVALVSIMAVNNEVGTIQPIAEITQLVHNAGSLMHTDAVQAFGHIPFDVEALGVDSASITAHKLGGPVGIGALYLKSKTPFVPFLVGGGQELGKRSGTQDVVGAQAFAAAAHDQVTHLAERGAHLTKLRENLFDQLTQCDYIHRTVPAELADKVHPGIASVLVDGVESETLILRLDNLGYHVAAGSACSSGSAEISGVLGAMQIPKQLAMGSLRISFDERITQEDLSGFAATLIQLVNELKGIRA